jgi:hypothetical protein
MPNKARMGLYLSENNILRGQVIAAERGISFSQYVNEALRNAIQLETTSKEAIQAESRKNLHQMLKGITKAVHPDSKITIKT